MAAYLLKRLGMTIAVVLVVVTFLVSAVQLIPGSPAQVMLGPRATPALIAEVNRDMDLDHSVPRQIVDFIGNAVQGNLGTDFVTQRPVTSLIAAALPNTVILAVAGLGIAILIGVPLGILSATRPNSWFDRITGVISVSLITVPSYLAGLILLLVFSVELRLLPAIGNGNSAQPLNYMEHLILPACALAISWIGYLARLVRASMLEVMNENYIRSARAFGCRDRLIFYKHGLKNAVIPTVAILGVGLGNLMGGAIFVEAIFARSGLGTLVLNAIQIHNYSVVRGGVLVIAILFVMANLLADLSYRLLDPRIRMEARQAR